MTETTTQPDPQVVAWEYAMVLTWPDGYKIDGRRRGEITPDPDRAFLGSTDGREARALYRRRPAGEWEPAPSGPLTVADIPAGQGTASLYMDGESTAVMYRAASGRRVPIPAGWAPMDDEEREALNAALEHLAATLPTIDTTEESK